jgi:hypothetical protein
MGRAAMIAHSYIIILYTRPTLGPAPEWTNYLLLTGAITLSKNSLDPNFLRRL